MAKKRTLAPRIPQPEPVATSYECSVCGLAWSLHPDDNPTVLDCIALLKAHATIRYIPCSQPHYPYQTTWYPTYYSTYTTTPGTRTTGGISAS